MDPKFYQNKTEKKDKKGGRRTSGEIVDELQKDIEKKNEAKTWKEDAEMRNPCRTSSPQSGWL